MRKSKIEIHFNHFLLYDCFYVKTSISIEIFYSDIKLVMCGNHYDHEKFYFDKRVE